MVFCQYHIMDPGQGKFGAMLILVLALLLPAVSHAENMDILENLPAGFMSGVSGMTGDPLSSLIGTAGGLSGIGGNIVGSAIKEAESLAGPLLKAGGAAGIMGGDIFKKDNLQGGMGMHKMGGIPKMGVKPVIGVVPVGIPIPGVGKGKILKAKAVLPLKKVAVTKAVMGAKLLAPKVKAATLLKAKPKVYSLKPIVHIIEKPVPVYHKVPVPKKVIVPKFYPVFKPIPVPKIVPVPFKVPIKKIIPKFVKVPKAVPVPKFVPYKKYIPVGIPYPVPKPFGVPIPKPMPYPKYIPIPIKKKVPKFVPFPVKKIIKVPKPFYVPIKVPHFTASYVKTPMNVKVPSIPKMPGKFGMPVAGKFGVPVPGKFGMPVAGKFGVPVPVKVPSFKGSSPLNFIPSHEEQVFKVKDADTEKDGESLFKL